MGEKSEKAFPFDSDKDSMGNNDREYYADDFARYFRSFISSGVFMKNADNLQILANDDMTVTLRPGSAIIDGYKYDNTADIVVELDPADGVLNRIDRISVTWSKGERDIHKTVQKGTSSYEPIAQECRRNEEYKDYVLADIYIPAGAIKITQDNITDQRLNTELCGLAMPFSDIDTTMIFNQLQAFYEKVVAENADWEDEKKVAFDEWFESVKDQLSGDVAGNLQNQIGNLEDLTTTNKGSLVEAINEVNEKEVDVLDTKEEIEANTDSGKVAGALAVKEMVGEVSASLVADNDQQFQFAYDSETGKYGYKAKVEGADTFFPFSNLAESIKCAVFFPLVSRCEMTCINASKLYFKAKVLVATTNTITVSQISYLSTSDDINSAVISELYTVTATQSTMSEWIEVDVTNVDFIRITTSKNYNTIVEWYFM